MSVLTRSKDVVVGLGGDAAVVRFPLAGVDPLQRHGRSEPCPQCGSLGFTVHQRSWKRIKDPHLSQVPVDRYRCKRCRWVGRSYPTGIGPGRQSEGQRQLSVLLYAIGLSYNAVRRTLASLGSDVSETTVRHNVRAARQAAPRDLQLSRLHLDVVGRGRLEGSDGALALSVAGVSAAERWLEISVAPGSRLPELEWRIEQGVAWMLELAATPPPESAETPPALRVVR